MNENLMILQQIDAGYENQIQNLRFRHRKAHDLYKLAVYLIVLALSVSLYSWGLDVWAQRRADQQTADARVLWNAELAAKEDAAKKAQATQAKSEADILAEKAQVVAKAFQGIKNFIDLYHYDRSDLETYARCIFNRYDAGNGVNSLQVIVSRKGQFTGYSDSLTPLTEYVDLAKEFIRDWEAETSKPCDLSYQCAELTPDGIYLVTSPNPGPYDRRWHA
jgi:hypothetical protein